MTEMEMSPGERCEIVVNLADGKPAELLTVFEDEEDSISGMLLNLVGLADKPTPALTLMVDNTLPAQTAPLPDKLATIDRPAKDQIVKTREFILDMDHDGGNSAHAGHALMDMTINGAVMDMNVINERVERGVWERWRLQSNQGEHPFHVHGCSFLIEQTGGGATPADQQGWKDTMVLDDDGWSEFIVRFDYPATDEFPYMYHCHILEHEDRGMMGQFTVS